MNTARKLNENVKFFVKKLAHGDCTLREAAESTGYSYNWLSHLKNEYRRIGADCFIHKAAGHRAYNAISEKIREKIILLYINEYNGINFKYFQKCLAEFDGIKISYSALRALLSRYNIVSPERRKHKKERVHRLRQRRQNFGDMIQVDGTPFRWFSWAGDNSLYSLHVAIDDATGRLTGLYMCQNECLYGYMELLRQAAESCGLPREIYSDRAAIFAVTPRRAQNLSVEEQLAGLHQKRTQWQRILSDLQINQILAWSPAAKGRVERCNATLQRRLPYLFKRFKIKTPDAANSFLQNQYIDIFNREFAVPPARADSFFRPCPGNLDNILCAKFPRAVRSGGVVNFETYHLRIECLQNPVGKKVSVCVSEQGICAEWNGRYYPVTLLDKHLTAGLSDAPAVLTDIMYRYLYAPQKEISC